jgi:hypothetical protein
MKAHQERMMAKIKTDLEEMKSVADTTVKPFGALKKWHGDQHLAIGHH